MSLPCSSCGRDTPHHYQQHNHQEVGRCTETVACTVCGQTQEVPVATCEANQKRSTVFDNTA